MAEGRQFVVEILDAQAGKVETVAVSGMRVIGSRVTGTAVGGAYSLTTWAGNGQSAIVGATVVPPAVRVTDANGLPVASSTVTFVLGAGDTAAASGMTQTTDSNGVATVGSWSMGTTAGQANVLQAFSTNLANSPLGFTITPTAASAFSAAVSAGNSQSTTPTGVYPSRVTVLVHDQYGNAAASATVTWTSSDSDGSFSASTGATDASGLLGVVYTAGQNASTQSIYGAISSATSARFGLGIVAGRPNSITLSAGDGQTALSSTTLPIAISGTIDDGFGNAIGSGETIQYVIVAGSGNISLATQTPVSSAWSVEWQTGAGTGQNKLEISVLGISNSTVTATASATNPLADTIAIESGNSQTGTVNAALSLPLAVAATASGSSAAGQLVTFSATAGSLSTSLIVSSATGVARTVWTLPTTASTETVTASAGTLTGSPLYFVATATADSASSLTFSVRPSSQPQAGVAFPQQPVILSTDVYGNPVSTSTRVEAVLVSGTGPLSSGVSTFAVGSGVTATFSGLSIGATGDHVLGFRCNSLSTCTALVTGDPPFASQLAFTTQPSATVAGQGISPSVVVAVQDSQGNTVTTATNQVTVAISGSGVLSGTAVVTAAAGLATFSALGIDATCPAATYTLAATADGLTGATSSSFAVTAGGYNEPAGMTVIVDNALTSQPSGWNSDTPTKLTFKDGSTYVVPTTSNGVTISNPGVGPGSPPGIMQMKVAKNDTAGQASTSLYKAATFNYKSLYIRGWFQMSTNWSGAADGACKMLQPLTNTGGVTNRIVVAPGYGATTGALSARVAFQGTVTPGTTSYQAGNIQGKTTVRGTWHRAEVLVIGNSNAVANGIFVMWIDGTKTHEYTTYQWDAANVTFKNLLMTNMRGGSTPAAPDDMYIWWDHLYVSGSASRVGGY